ncbi:hypothetical protein GCM10009628_03980 [Paeniglutamicibacter kerguelensis]
MVELIGTIDAADGPGKGMRETGIQAGQDDDAHARLVNAPAEGGTAGASAPHLGPKGAAPGDKAGGRGVSLQKRNPVCLAASIR